MKRLIYCYNHDEYLRIPNTIESIDDYAFFELPLKRIDIPVSVKRIGNSAFSCCDNLETINLFNVSSVGEMCFSWCNSLKEIKSFYPEMVNDYTFSHCEQLETIKINEHTKIIKKAAFAFPRS